MAGRAPTEADVSGVTLAARLTNVQHKTLGDHLTPRCDGPDRLSGMHHPPLGLMRHIFQCMFPMSLAEWGCRIMSEKREA